MLDREIVLFIISIVTTLGAGFALAYRFGSKMQSLEDANKFLTENQNRLEAAMAEEKAHNAKQHEEFYSVKNDTIELKLNMQHVMKSLDKIENILERAYK